MTTTSIYRAEVSSRPAARFDGDGNPISGTGQALEIRSEARGPGWSIGIPAPRLTGAEPSRRETELRAAARRRGLTMKELGAKMGVSVGHLSGVATGRKPWTSRMRERAVSVLGEVSGQGVVYRQGGVVSGESSYIRERVRALGMSMQDLAERVGVTPGYMTQVSRGYRNMSVKVQARVESALEAPAKVAPAKCAGVDRQAVWDRMNAHGISQNEVARRADGRKISPFDIAKELIEGDTVQAEEIVIEVPDGRSVTTLVNATPIRSENGTVESCVVTIQDMTALEELERLRAEFLAMVSHELRTPLTSVKGSITTLLDPPSPLNPAEMRQFHQIIDAQVNRMHVLISDLLDVARIETGTLAVSPEPTDVGILISEARNGFRSGGGKHNIEIDLAPDGHVPSSGVRVRHPVDRGLCHCLR